METTVLPVASNHASNDQYKARLEARLRPSQVKTKQARWRHSVSLPPLSNQARTETGHGYTPA